MPRRCSRPVDGRPARIRPDRYPDPRPRRRENGVYGRLEGIPGNRPESDARGSPRTRSDGSPRPAVPPDFAEFGERLALRLRLGDRARTWIRSRNLDPDRLAAAGWASVESDEDREHVARSVRATGVRRPGPVRSGLVVPVWDADGRTVSARVRAFDGPALTLPGDRARLYGLDACGAEPGGVLHVAEGETDAETLREAGAVAVLGLPGVSTLHGDALQLAAATRARLLAVWFDGDAPGREAAARLSDRATAAGIPVRPWLFPEGMDANDAWRRSPDPEAANVTATKEAVRKLAKLPEAPDSTSGRSLLAAALDKLPCEVRAVARPDPLLPVVRVSGEPRERTRGRIAFGGILDTGDPPPGQLTLFPSPGPGPRVAILEVSDAYGVPTMARGRGAPLELGVFVSAATMTPQDARRGRSTVVTTVRELRSYLFGPRWNPTGRNDRPGDWERVREAALRASNLWLPVPHPSGGAPDLWRAVAVRKIPAAVYDADHLNREVVFDVELPPGSGSGPPIDRRELSRLRRVSGPRYRAYIAAHSTTWTPGRTRVPHPRNRSHRVWTLNRAPTRS